MLNPVEKSCPRCKTAFTCKADDIANCQCAGIQLSEAAISFMDTAFSDCLCKECLVAVNREAKEIKN